MLFGGGAPSPLLLLIMHAMSDRFEQAQLKNFSLNSVLKREESAFS